MKNKFDHSIQKALLDEQGHFDQVYEPAQGQLSNHSRVKNAQAASTTSSNTSFNSISENKSALLPGQKGSSKSTKSDPSQI
mmetsp:Transcript_6305/g.5719  ORF Transcript_6305/g.5719 Transcript_6305/m.5719 type:complete len:81 (-) Transcript_6305:3657-3899(-)